MTTVDSARSSGLDEGRLLRDYVLGAKLMQLATADTGLPWLAHVWFATDERLNLYFLSNRTRRHSEELRRNANVAGGIVNIDLVGLGQVVRAVTFEGSANELEAQDLRAGYEVYATRWPQVLEMVPLAKMLSAETPNRIYMIRVRKYVLFDEANFPESPRRIVSVW